LVVAVALQLTGPVPEQLSYLGVFNPNITIVVPGDVGPENAPRLLNLAGNKLSGPWPHWLLSEVSGAELNFMRNLIHALYCGKVSITAAQCTVDFYHGCTAFTLLIHQGCVRPGMPDTRTNSLSCGSSMQKM
jgi:hypothetical protein